ncbi:MAG: lysophospholipid acyltransferase family protein [Armatimonadetes bacterium]|nr:lysophospholipid acyltransferase family protein [Armatimonadota bacterium]
MSTSSRLWRPWSVRVVGNLLGIVFYYASARYRNVALKNLRSVYGQEMGEVQIRALAKRVFKHFTRGAIEFFFVLSLNSKQINELVDVSGCEHLDSALSEGNGCIVITAHYGNWELLARKLALFGYKINVIARDSDDPGMTGITAQIRESGGYRVFDKDRSLIGAMRALRRNEVLGILPDQHDSQGIFVDFFSRPAATATGPATFALKSSAPLVPVFASRTADGRYNAVVYPRIDFNPSGNIEKDTKELTSLINIAIEQAIRLQPDQWLWFHNRWKSSAPAEVNSSGQ